MTEAKTEYVLHYRHGGQVWAFNPFAVDDEDAERKVERVRATLELKGRLIGRAVTLEEAAQAAAQGEADQLIRRLGG